MEMTYSWPSGRQMAVMAGQHPGASEQSITKVGWLFGRQGEEEVLVVDWQVSESMERVGLQADYHSGDRIERRAWRWLHKRSRW